MKKLFLVLALSVAGQAWAAPAPESNTATRAPGPALKVTGAGLVTGQPLLLTREGEEPSEPSFDVLSATVQHEPAWIVESYGDAQNALVTRLNLKSAAGVKLTMDVDTALKTSLDLKLGDTVTAETSRAGRGAMVVFSKGKTPFGLVPNDQVRLPN